MLKQFELHLNEKLPFLKESKILIAISGGVDSVVLAYLCKQMNLNIALAHCNFNLRGPESDADEDFVMELAKDWDLEVFIENFQVHFSGHMKRKKKFRMKKMRLKNQQSNRKRNF